jgi:hypothetical protein
MPMRDSHFSPNLICSLLRPTTLHTRPFSSRSLMIRETSLSPPQTGPLLCNAIPLTRPEPTLRAPYRPRRTDSCRLKLRFRTILLCHLLTQHICAISAQPRAGLYLGYLPINHSAVTRGIRSLNTPTRALVNSEPRISKENPYIIVI